MNSTVVNISSSISDAALQYPDATALSSGATQITYRELDHQASQLASHLSTLGVSSGSTVAILLERSFHQIVSALAVMRAGATYLPLDPAWPDERVRTILTDAAASVLIATPETSVRVAGKLPNVCPLRDAKVIAAATSRAEFPAIATESLAYLIYTSGSTGVPKGVEITHGNLMHLIAWHHEAFDVSSSNRASHIAGLGFDAAVWEIWPYLAAGACIQLPDSMDELVRTSPPHLLRWLHDGHITHAFVPTALAESLVASAWPETTKLRFLLTGGDVLHTAPRADLPFVFVNNYGPTECTVVATSAIIEASAATPPPIGRPIEGTQAYVLDAEGRQVAPGVAGELYLGGAGVGRGYRNLPEQTNHVFLPDPFSSIPEGRMYRTGDLVSALPDGQLAFHGRLDSQEKIRGQRIELDEITTVLNHLEGIAFSAVVTRIDAGGEKQLVAFVLPRHGATLTIRDLQDELVRVLPAAMIPSVFVRLAGLPLNTSGKLDLSLLPQVTAENLLTEPVTREASTSLEVSLLEMLRGLLHIDSVGVDDDFFLVGGHSLLGAQLVLRIRATFGVELTLRDLFEAPTVALLATRVEGMLISQIDSMTDDEAEAEAAR